MLIQLDDKWSVEVIGDNVYGKGALIVRRYGEVQTTVGIAALDNLHLALIAALYKQKLAST